jgi:hypothetical protein
LTAPKPEEAKTTDASAPTPAVEEPPAIPATKPAPGMSATSGPLGDEPDFGADDKDESAAPAAAPAPEVTPAPATDSEKK